MRYQRVSVRNRQAGQDETALRIAASSHVGRRISWGSAAATLALCRFINEGMGMYCQIAVVLNASRRSANGFLHHGD
jgi:hypothetical protein